MAGAVLLPLAVPGAVNINNNNNSIIVIIIIIDMNVSNSNICINSTASN